MFLKNLVRDLVALRLPVTAAAVVATVASLVEPFGVNLGGDTTAKVTAALVAVGVVAEYVKSRSQALTFADEHRDGDDRFKPPAA